MKCVKWKYEGDAKLFTLICIRKHYCNSNMDLVLPYIPHARMDRVKAEEDGRQYINDRILYDDGESKPAVIF